ncbi:DUF1651 domain-containing protein [Prochlorococcus sp. MIT 1223]|uniref:DUF1651 domain-containing protein n=1 Tax=Prochlorococcus sp. MIT 1223 TaxID=3096217 RepID=UPI002A762975|nr:DUF1651 domain-containing protein [Prochlorococcus sp. MIT 1223]
MQIVDELPSGWLVSPCGEQLVLFIKDPMSPDNLQKYYLDKWSAFNGNRNKFKSRRIFIENEAIKIWHELINKGWNKFEIRTHNVA